MTEHIAVIDTETTWSGALMTVGIMIADTSNYKAVDYRYYVIKEAVREGGKFGYFVHIEGIDEEKVSVKKIGDKIISFLIEHNVSSIFAYNAGFDRNCMPFLERFVWHDIMKIAAYKQYNPMIPDSAECCNTGRLKRGYGVENIMRLLGHPFDFYPKL